MERSMWFLDQKDMPTKWYNIMVDMPEPMPPLLHPGTGKPATVDDAAGLFPRACAEQELNTTDRWIEIPEELQAVYRTLETNGVTPGAPAGESPGYSSQDFL